ncbi:MAG: hypothetical protein JWN44_5374 [Myxococcales bacterium]|nr:hypothetical protein [Myxococcales bacterium]
MRARRRDLVLSDVERRVALREIVGFETLSDEALSAIARLSRRRELSPGSTTRIQPGERRTSICLLAGDLELLRMGRVSPFAHDRRVLDVYWLARDSMPLEVKTAGGAVVLEFPLDGLEEVLEEHFSVWVASTQTLASCLLNVRPPSPEQTVERLANGDLRRLTERLAALQEALPFGRGYIDALMQLDEEAVEVRYDVDDVIWRPGDEADSVLVPLDGAVRGVASDEPCGIGSLEVLASRVRSTALEVARPFTALRVGRESLFDLVEDHHELARDLLAMIAASVVQSVEDG